MLINLLIFSVLSVVPAAAPSADDVPAATPVYAGVAVADGDTDASDASNDKAPSKSSALKLPFVSINTDVLDMSWTSAMDQADPAILRPTGIVLPFLESYPLDNFEVKLHLLNVQF